MKTASTTGEDLLSSCFLSVCFEGWLVLMGVCFFDFGLGQGQLKNAQAQQLFRDLLVGNLTGYRCGR